MAALIRAAALNPQPRVLAQRKAAAAVAPPQAPSAPPVAPPPVIDAEAQAAWRRQAEQELATARQRAEQEGHAAGHAKGQADGLAAYRDKLDHLDRLIDRAGRSFSAQIEGLEDIAVGIAFEALVKLLGDRLVTPAGVHAVVSQVLQRTKEQEKLVVHLAPGDFYLLLQHSEGSAALERPGVELVPDERIELGGCLVETSAGTLDGRIEAQLEVLKQALLQVRRDRSAKGTEA